MPHTHSSPIEPSETFIGSVEAARLLRMNRSSINYAVNKGYLKPDGRTPKGQLRFKEETILAYGARGSTATAGTGARAREDAAAREARLDLLRQLASELATGTDVDEICKHALVGIRQIHSNIHLAAVAELKPTAADPLHANLLASEGVSSQLLKQASRFGRIRDLAYRQVFESGDMLRCDDTLTATLTPTSRLFVTHSRILSFRVLPIKEGVRTIGLLMTYSNVAHAFSDVADAFLSQIAEQLAAAITSNNRTTKLQDYLTYAGDLMMRGMEEYAVGGVATFARLEEMLAGMAQAYCDATGAYTVICTAGPPAPGMVQDERVRALAEFAAQSRRVEADEWRTDEGRVMAIATPVPVGGGAFAGMAAAWREERRSWHADIEVLRIFAAACILALSGLLRPQAPAGGTDATVPTVSS